jgi:predicted GNAT family acetyltransferase
MDLTRYEDPAAFLTAARSWFEAAEEQTGLIYGLALRLVDDPTHWGSPPYLALVHDRGEPVLAALMTPPHAAVVHGSAAPAALVVDDLLQARSEVPGVLGPVELAAEVAHAWREATGGTTAPRHHQRAFVLREVRHPDGVSGRLRLADDGDLALVTAWQQAFVAEALGDDEPGDAEAAAKHAIVTGACWLWEDGEPVSMAQNNRRTVNGATISAVYTPPERRGQGYASAVVAGVSQQLLDQGFAFCTLFTDLANPTSNHIYQQIGYQPVADFDQLRFTR